MTKLSDLKGIAPNCTDGMPSEEWVRKIRKEFDEDIRKRIEPYRNENCYTCDCLECKRRGIAAPDECDPSMGMYGGECGKCGATLYIVRPGEYQCPNCE